MRLGAARALVLVLLGTTGASVAQPRGPLNDPARAQRDAEERAREDEERLRGEALERELPGLEMAEELPALFFFPALQLRLPYQPLGLGATFAGLPAPWLRLSALYSFGITPHQVGVVWTSYAEASVGVRVLGVDSETAVDVPLKRRGRGFFPNVPVVKAWAPSYHALFVEAGGLSGFTSLRPCVRNCPEDPEVPDTEATQLVMPMGGVRYIYGYDVRSKRRHARKRLLFELYAHVLGPPFNAPEGQRYFPNGSSAGRAGFGGRAGVTTSPFGACIAAVVFGFGCLDGGVAFGYASYPRAAIFEMQVGGFMY